MRNKSKIIISAILSGVLIVALVLYFRGKNFAVLNPAGTIANQQRDLMIIATLLMLIIVIPVFILTFYIGWKYRAGNKKATYIPDWDHSRILETIWWGFPIAIIAIIGVLIWKSSHSLDPFRPIEASKKPMTIQVIALDWKWLFIYPEQNIATVNYVAFPEQTPIDFEITSDAPMNSFWIPQLGGQIYAMAGMSTHLNLMADQPGIYNGSSANLSGAGFAGMKFTAESQSEADFKQWADSVQHGYVPLTLDAYNKLAEKSENNPKADYATVDKKLYDTVMNKYMAPESTDTMHMDMKKDDHDSMQH